MRKVIDRGIYYSQENNAQVKLFERYFGSGRAIACGPTCAAMAFHITRWPMDVFTPGVQPEDSILMMVHNPHNMDKLKARRDIDYDKFPPGEVPQVYDVVGEMLYSTDKACRFKWGLDFETIKSNINRQVVMMICGNFPAGGHYVLVVGYDDDDETIIYNDPYGKQWMDGVGQRREMSAKFLAEEIQRWRVDFYPYI